MDWNPMAGRTLAAEPSARRLARAWEQRDDLSAARLLRVLQEMGAFARPGQRRDRASLASELGVVPAHAALFEVLLGILVTAGLLAADGPDLVAAGAATEVAERDLAAEGERLSVEHPELAAHLRLLNACLSEYPRMLRGEAKPLSVLFPGWSMDLVEGVYRGDPVADRLNDIAAQATAAHVAAVGRAAPVRIIEVGAGTGGTTAPVLQALAPYPGCYTYTYTDVSASFLRHAAQRFAAPEVSFRRLDLEAPLPDQGFAEGGFDLVVAANVLHATKDLPGTLDRIARLLAPGGRLVLREITEPLIITSLSFGLLEGWWSATDGLRIPGSPLADVPTWTKLLTETGFARVAALPPFGDGADSGADVFGQHILVADR